MCGRYCITSAPQAIRQLFGYKEQPNFPPRYNVAPTQPVPIVRQEQGERHFALVRWGLLPGWAKDPKAFTLLINGRGETVNEKPAFRNAMKRRRCLFPADGFYEWKDVGGVRRAFHARRVGGGPLVFAGLWETWAGPNGEEIETAAIVTTAANATLAAVHNRAPLVLPPEAFDRWLDCVTFDEREAAALIAPAPDGLMEVYEVSNAVGRVANDTPDLVEPLTPEAAAAAAPVAAPVKRAVKPKRTEDTRQGSLF